MQPGRLLLWDIDGTLVNGGETGTIIFNRALEFVVGALPPERIRMSGKTDPQIVREYLELMGIEEPGAHSVVLARAEIELADAADVFAAKGNTCPGVRAVLSSLAEHSSVTQTVLTGNLKPNAKVKLAAFGLDHFLNLEIGAYGSDDADRNSLVPIALERVARGRERPYVSEQVWVIGDTPSDLACARAGGVRCLLVATGRFSYEELEPLGADVTLVDLTDTGRVVELLCPPVKD